MIMIWYEWRIVSERWNFQSHRVISYDSGARTVTTIEGNASDAVIQGYPNIDDNYILGFGDDGGVVADNSNMNIFKLYNMESQYGFAKLFGIDLSNKHCLILQV